jgi:hypothetical protein
MICTGGIQLAPHSFCFFPNLSFLNLSRLRDREGELSQGLPKIIGTPVQSSVHNLSYVGNV